MSCDELPEDQEILSSDEEDLLLLLPSKERIEFKAKLRKEIKSWKKTDPQKWEEHLAINKKQKQRKQQKQPIELQEDCELEVAQLLAEMLTGIETESEEAWWNWSNGSRTQQQRSRTYNYIISKQVFFNTTKIPFTKKNWPTPVRFPAIKGH